VNDTIHWFTWVIFSLTYAGLALGRIPGLRIDRAGIAFVGAALMLVSGVLTIEQAVSFASIDYKTIFLLFGMMIVVGALRISGFFERLGGFALRFIGSPRGLLAATVAMSGILSAFLINDVVCVALTPLVLHLARRMRFDPIPHLIGLATAANVGSTGTITGNPQNIYIGTHSGIPYLRFAARLLPVAIFGLGLTYLVVAVIYSKRLAESPQMAAQPPDSEQPNACPPSRSHVRLQIKAAVVTLVAVVLFFTSLPLELVALGAAAVVLLDRIKPEKIYGQVDWSLLLMFVGLFIVVHAFQVHIVSGWGINGWTWLLDRPIDLLSLVSVALSNLVSNVPAVLLLEPVAQAVPTATRETAWLALAMSSTFAGNLTLLGSVANLIVVECARREGVTISFWEYCKVGVPLTILTLFLGIGWLQFVRY
jgi:Na+/H+ antiporter NhaD/arsenite permease-like protein